MTYKEKISVANIVSSLLITGVYFLIVYNGVQSGRYVADDIFRFWAVALLIFIPISVVARIVIMIVFHILNAIGTEIKSEITGEEADHYVDITDERDKLIELKSTRVSLVVFGLGFILALVTQLFDVSNHYFFITFLLSGVLSELLGEIATILYYRRGV